MNEAAKQENAQARSRRRIRTATYIILAVAAILAVYIYIQSLPPPSGKYDAFAQCIAQTNTKFYGAFWCPHCAAQKQEFGDSAHYLPYVECSLPDESGQTQVCIDHNIQSYPTWVFPDGSQLTGTQSLETLAQKTGCTLPGAAGGATSTTGTTGGVGSSSPALP